MPVLAMLLAVALFGATVSAHQQPPSPPCTISDDPTYGYTRENPVQVGGGALYVRAREERYLNALRGPEGQRIAYKRIGQATVESDPAKTILDQYELTYEGLDKPITLFLDAYHFWVHRAPRGLTCAEPFNLLPIPDAFRASDSLLAVALEQGAARDFDPIPLNAADGSTRGRMWDGFRMLARAARAAAAAGKPLTPAARPPAGTVIVAHPLSCDGRTVAPVTIDLMSQQGVPLEHELVKSDAIAAVLPGVDIPRGSIAARFKLQQVRPADRVKITYAEAACAGTTTEVIVPMTFTPTRGVEMPEPALPDGATPEQNRVLLQVLVDLDGRFQRAVYTGGPSHLAQPAIEAVKAWRAEPARVNGAPVPWATLLEVRFK